MRDDFEPASTAPLAVQRWPFTLVCATAGALAVPVHAVATPVSAAVAGLVGLAGLNAWRWARLPSAMKAEAPGGVDRLVNAAGSMGLGLIVGLLFLGLLRLGIEPVVPAIGTRLAAAALLPVWRRALVIFVAAVGEEVVFRLVLLSLVAGLTTRLFRLRGRIPTRRIVWAANGISALAFAAVHLPAWSGAVPLSPGLMLSVVALNALGGAVFGYLFANRGIAAAMWAHAGADCALQLIGPLTG